MLGKENLVIKLETMARELANGFNKLPGNRKNQKHKSLSKMHSITVALRDIKAGVSYQIVDNILVLPSTKVNLSKD